MYREEQLTRLLEGRRILIAGYGREGRSAHALMEKLLPGHPVTIANGDEEIAALSAEPFDLIVKSPGVPMRLLAADATAQVTSLTDLFLQVYGDLTVGVTGTKGKSTTASLIHQLIPGSILAGNIGIPLFDILELLDEDSVVVAELSCHQLEVLHRAPHVAVLLNLYQEHLDHYADYEAYKMAKLQIALCQQAGDHLFYCTDNEELVGMVEKLQHSISSCIHSYSAYSAAQSESVLLDACPLPGLHNRGNALVALRVASLVANGSRLSGQDDTVHYDDARYEEYRHLMSSFHALHHRMEPLGVHAGLKWFDDSISTIPAASIAALKALGKVDTLILGGFDRGIDYTPLVDYLEKHHVDNLVFVGKAGRRMLSLFHKPPVSFLVEDDYARIVPWCAQATREGGIVLLSPAAASYDAFKNFEQRGDCFRQQIEKLS